MAIETGISEAELAELVGIAQEATTAYISGDIRHYFSLFEHPPEYTLMPPNGGDTWHGFEPTEEGMDETSRFFARGEGTFDLEASYVAGDMAVLVAIERQHGEVGGTADQDWSLRVTLVFRRVGARWHLLHRHADPLVRELPWERFAEIARGELA